MHFDLMCLLNMQCGLHRSEVLYFSDNFRIGNVSFVLPKARCYLVMFMKGKRKLFRDDYLTKFTVPRLRNSFSISRCL